MIKIAGKEVGALGYGLMGFTIQAEPIPDEKIFPLLRRAVESGCTFWNSGSFYGRPDPTAGLQLLSRYFAKYPEDREKVVLSVKGCFSMMPMRLDASRAGCRESVQMCCDILGTYIDLFEPARVDPKIPIEETMFALVELLNEGKIRSIGLSECSAATIRRAAVVHTIAAVEQEYSLWSTEIEDNDILKTCADLDIPIVAYSPLVRGILGGQIKQKSDIPESDIRHMMPRFSDENMSRNLKLLQRLEAFAHSKGVALSQVAIAWVAAQGAVNGAKILPIPGTTSATRLEENIQSTRVTLSTEELDELRAYIQSVSVSGGRYAEAHSALLYGNTPEVA